MAMAMVAPMSRKIPDRINLLRMHMREVQRIETGKMITVGFPNSVKEHVRKYSDRQTYKGHLSGHRE